MAKHADTLAVDDTKMTADRNAAIWYARDGYDPDSKGINGRRVAGRSFLEGFLTHADVDEFIAIGNSRASAQHFRELATPKAAGRPVHVYALDEFRLHNQISTVYYPGPTLGREAWRRFAVNQTAFSICGITHTISTSVVMQQIFDLRVAPVEPWDALICTSRSVQAAVTWQIEQIDAYIERRFGYSPPPPPQLPVIPLGVNQSQVAGSVSSGAALRKTLGIGPDACVAMIMSRLSVNEKFDPLPIYQALQIAQSGFDGQIALILCGYFGDKSDENIFLKGAEWLMPDVPLHVVDGKDPSLKAASFAAADMFLFCIDNLQETFGIAPIEAMAAGLPLIVSDWDGMKDTVTADVGFRIPTLLAEVGNRGRPDALRYFLEQDDYHRYLSTFASRTVIDVADMAEKILLLAKDRERAATMGDAARDRAARIYDWSAIIPQYQNLWEELTHLRRAAKPGQSDRYKDVALPVAPPPVDLFKSYPTQVGLPLGTRVSASHADAAGTPDAIAALARLRHAPLNARHIEVAQLLWQECHASGQGDTISAIAAKLRIYPAAAEQLAAWLLKYDFLRITP